MHLLWKGRRNVKRKFITFSFWGRLQEYSVIFQKNSHFVHKIVVKLCEVLLWRTLEKSLKNFSFLRSEKEDIIHFNYGSLGLIDTEQNWV